MAIADADCSECYDYRGRGLARERGGVDVWEGLGVCEGERRNVAVREGKVNNAGGFVVRKYTCMRR